MEQYTSRKEREGIEARFDTFMNKTIENYARNVTRKVTRDEKKRRGVPIDSLDEDALECMAIEDVRHIEDPIILEADLRITVSDEQIEKILACLTEREAQILVLKTVFDLDYDMIAEKLRISRDRAKAYKYHGVRKAKEGVNENGSEQ